MGQNRTLVDGKMRTFEGYIWHDDDASAPNFRASRDETDYSAEEQLYVNYLVTANNDCLHIGF